MSTSKFQISKSRYDSISLYLSPGPVYSGGCCSGDEDNEKISPYSVVPNGSAGSFFKTEYNDLDVPYDSKIFDQLKEGGIFLFFWYLHL